MRGTDRKGNILVVDDEPSMRTSLSILLKRQGYEVSRAGSGKEALGMLEAEQFDMVLTDLKMEEVNGMELLKRVKEGSPDTEVLIFTAYGTVDSAVEAMKTGAYDYITKPFEEEELLMKVERALEHSSLVKEVSQLKAQLRGQKNRDKIVAKSKEMTEVLTKAAQVAPTRATVLIQGESGTGKEIVAGAIHRGSGRQGAFVPINCSNLPENLLESELFGYEKGAFTGAAAPRKGLVEAAHKGTLLLDEVGDMPLPLQGKILRLLQDGEIRRLGSTHSVRVDVRILAATNKEIDALVAEDLFREDLFYRLNVVRIYVPPLKDRPDDIIPLARQFLVHYGEIEKKQVKGFTPEAVQAMLDYDWPGNVRELENAVERALILTRSDHISRSDLSLPLSSSSTTPSEGTSLKEVQHRHILSVLKRHGGNQAAAARELRIGRNTLWRWLRKTGENP